MFNHLEKNANMVIDELEKANNERYEHPYFHRDLFKNGGKNGRRKDRE